MEQVLAPAMEAVAQGWAALKAQEAYAPTLEAMEQGWLKLDATVSEAVFVGLEKVGLPLREWGQSPITSKLPFVASPTPLLVWIAIYLLVVLLGLLMGGGGKKSTSTKSTDPFLVRAFVQLHNLFLIVLSSYMFGGTVYFATKAGYNFWGNAYHPSEVELGQVIYVFYMSKWYEFFDTFIMLMKGNLNQVSFLHVYHHVSISCIWWVIAYAAPGGDAYYSCFLNSLVHVVMYTYYLLAALLGKESKARKKYLWWGQYLTMFQMAQFISMMAQATYVWKYSPYPKPLATLLFYYMQTLLALFANFFIKKYLGGSSKGKKKSA